MKHIPLYKSYVYSPCKIYLFFNEFEYSINILVTFLHKISASQGSKNCKLSQKSIQILPIPLLKKILYSYSDNQKNPGIEIVDF